MKKVILPTDFSDNAFNAIEYAFSFYQGIPCSFIIYHTFQLPLDASEMQPSVREKMEKNSQEEMDKILKKIHELNTDVDHSFSTFTEYIYAAQGILKLAKDENADAIFMGTQGASGLKEFFIGSVTSDVIQGAKCPVIAVPKDVSFHKPKKIVFATDLEPLSDFDLLNPLIETVEHFETHLMVLHTFRKGRFLKVPENLNVNANLQNQFSSIRDSFHYKESDKPAEGIEKFIVEHKADMLAMVTRDHGFFKSIFHQSTVEHMAFHSKIPLFAIHN